MGLPLPKLNVEDLNSLFIKVLKKETTSSTCIKSQKSLGVLIFIFFFFILASIKDGIKEVLRWPVP